MNDVQKLLQAKFQSAYHDFQQGRLGSAEKSLHEMLEHVPGDPQVLNMMAGVAARKYVSATFYLGTAYTGLDRTQDDAIAQAAELNG